MKNKSRFGLILTAVVLVPLVVLLFIDQSAAAGYAGGAIVMTFVCNAWYGRIHR